jgi:hypothetical protein
VCVCAVYVCVPAGSVGDWVGKYLFT